MIEGWETLIQEIGLESGDGRIGNDISLDDQVEEVEVSAGSKVGQRKGGRPSE